MAFIEKIKSEIGGIEDSQVKYIVESLFSKVEDFEEIIRLLAAAELIGQLELVENLLNAADQWGPEIPRQNIVNALVKMRNDILEELRNLVVDTPFYTAATSELVKTPLTEKVREEARKALRKMKEGD